MKRILKKLASPSTIVICIIGIAFAYLVSVTWLKWGDLITDTSRELLTPYQILQGKVIYKDIFYPYGFLPPYFIAIIYKILGAYVNSLIFCGLAITFLMSALLYKIARIFLDEIFSALAVITFLFVFAFAFYSNNGTFNYMLPYSFASTFFMLFTMAALYSFLKYILTDNKKYIFLWCSALTLSFLSRPELSLPAWTGFFLMGIINILKFKKRRLLIEILFLIAPLLIGIICYLLYMFITQSFSGFIDSIFLYIKVNAVNKLTISLTGMNNVLSNNLKILVSFLSQLLIVYFLGTITFITPLSSRKENMMSFRIMFQILLVFVLFFCVRSYVTTFQYKCLPLLLLAGVVFYLVKLISHKDFKKNLAGLTLFLIALLLTLRIFLNTLPSNYGFYLLDPSIICYYIFFTVVLKKLFSTHIGFDENVYLPVLLSFFLLLIIPYWQISLDKYTKKSATIMTPRGVIMCSNSKDSESMWSATGTMRFWSALLYLEDNTSKDDTVLVFPEGASINFFAERPYPSKYHTFLPPDIETIGEDRIVSELAGSKIDYVVILTRNTAEYGYSAFGFDYAKKIYAWINKNYETVKQFGPLPNTTKEFGVEILRKKMAQKN